jgi:hypothetical protein
MSRLRLIAIVAGVLAGATALPATAASRTYFPDCQSRLKYQPRTVTVFCADGGMVVRRIAWTRWGDDDAQGSSRRAFANDCTANCAEGTFHRYHARLTLRRVRTCDDGRHAFTRMQVRFVGRKWSGPRQFTQKLFCPT